MIEEKDPGIDWIREVRHKISTEFDHDTKKFLDHYRELEKKYADRMVRDFKKVTDAVEVSK
ncbi:MAG: hypothetical protein AB7J13_04115 [Pyrinomonadaceae bacterium]